MQTSNQQDAQASDQAIVGHPASDDSIDRPADLAIDHLASGQQPLEAGQSCAEPKQHANDLGYILGTLVVFACLSIWMMQNSVNAYYQQTYHKQSPLMQFNASSAWLFGGEIGDFLYQQYAAQKAQVSAVNSDIVGYYNAHYAFTPEFKKQLAIKAEQDKIKLAQEQQAKHDQEILEQFTLTKTDEVFFAGDSLMQGVAPHVQKHLQEQFNLNTVNLSKQSTGLSYPGFFDWPQTIEDTIAANKNIKILVMFLGANDPWDMPNPKGGVYLKFESPDWEQVYRARIARIIQTAKQHHISVMWLSPPNMRKDSLNKQMVYLNKVIADEVKNNHAFLVDSRPLLGGKNDIYNDFLLENGKSIKMRSADGIHFSTEGQKAIASVIAKHLNVIQ